MELQQTNIDEIFRKSGLGRDYREAPPPAAWDKIARRLDGEDDDRRVGAFWLRWPFAALLLLLIGGGWFAVSQYGRNNEASGAMGGNIAAAGTAHEQGILQQGQKDMVGMESSSPLPADRTFENGTITTAARDKNSAASAEALHQAGHQDAGASHKMPASNSSAGHSSSAFAASATAQDGRSESGSEKPIAGRETHHGITNQPSIVATDTKLQEVVNTSSILPVSAKPRPARVSGEAANVSQTAVGVRDSRDTRNRDQDLADKPLATTASAGIATGHAASTALAGRRDVSRTKSAAVSKADAEKPLPSAVTTAPRSSVVSQPPVVLWPAHMAAPRVSILQNPVAMLHDKFVAAAQFLNALTSPILEYDVILSARPANTPLMYTGPAPSEIAADSLRKLLNAQWHPYFSFAALGGMEPGGGTPLQYRVSIAGRLLWHFKQDWSFGLQPALRYGQLSNTELRPAQAYQQSQTLVNGTIVQSISPSILNAIDTLYSYVIHQTDDSIVVASKVAKGSIWEVELPLLVDYRRGAWHLYGGPSLHFGGRFNVSGGAVKTYSKVWQDSIVQSVPIPAEAFNNYFGTSSSLPQYSTYKDDIQQPADVRTGYLVGIGWQRGRLMLDASAHGQLSGYGKVPAQMRGAYSTPGVRLSVGYMLSRPAAALLKTKEQ